MDLSFSQQDLAFRDQVRAFLAAHLPQDLAEKSHKGIRLKRDDLFRWQSILNDAGWMVPHWPEDHGGTGWSAIQLGIFEEECFLAGAPRPHPFGIRLVGPVIFQFGSDAQKARFLPRIRSSEDFWCQGFSEPGAGSDLAAIKTRAVRDGGDYVVNGQKTWTTTAHISDWMFALVRTDPDAPKKQQGISFLLINMKTPGITVRPIITLDGDHHVNEVFLEDVRVPAENLVGEENKGWDYAKFLLGHERTGIAGIGIAKQDMAKLKQIARDEIKDGRPLIEDPLFRARLARLEVDLRALELTNLRMLSDDGSGATGDIASVIKVRGSEIQQRTVELMMEAAGPYALPWQVQALEPDWNGTPVGPDHAAPAMPAYFDRRKTTIYGGSTEVQKNIIAKAILRL